MELLPYILWAIIVGSFSSLIGYLGACLLLRRKPNARARYAVVSRLLAIVFIGTAWYVNCWWIDRNSIFDGAIFPIALLTVISAPTAVVLALVMTAVLVRMRKPN